MNFNSDCKSFFAHLTVLMGCLSTIFFAGILVRAENTTQIRSVPLQPKTPGGKNRCVDLFHLPSYELQMIQSSPLRGDYSNGFAEKKHADKRSKVTVEWIDKILNEWQQSGHYTTKQIEWLRDRELKLAPERTSYHSTESAGRITGIRIFDGSTLPLIDSLTWGHIHAKDPRTPIEKKYGLRFPERDSRETAYIWELGLLSGPHFFKEAVSANFVRMARWLDQNYNLNQMGAFAETRQVELLNFAIYGVTRKQLLGKYEGLGFQKVINPKTNKPTVFDDGMILIRMSGKTLLENFFWGRDLPETDSYSYTIIQQGPGSRIHKATENAKRLDARRMYVMTPEQANHNLQVIYRHLVELKRLHDQEKAELNRSEMIRAQQGGSPREILYLGRELETQRALDELVIIWRSLPKGYVHYQTWFYMMGQIHFMLSVQKPAGAIEMAVRELESIGVINSQGQ